MKEPKYFGVDLETTGLDPAKGQILEIAVSILDEDLVELHRYDAVLPFMHTYELSMNAYVYEMHTNSGLLEEVRESVMDPVQVMRNLGQLLDMFEGNPTLAGQSVHFDERFLQFYYPEFHFSHRYLDARTVLLLQGVDDVPGTRHRARSDLNVSLNILRDARAGLEFWKWQCTE